MSYQRLFDFNQPGLLIDCHGTISAATFWTNFHKAELTRLARTEIFEKRPDLVHSWMLGDVSAREIHELLASELNVEFDWLWNRFTSQARRLKIEGLPQLSKLRRNFRIAIVTINVDTFTEYTVPSKKLKSYVDVVVNSADVHLQKIDQGVNLFNVATEILSCPAENSILIDDDDKVCAFFAERGGHSICVRNVQQTLLILDELIQLSELYAPTNANEIIQKLSVGKLSTLLSWNEQVRSSYS